MLVFTILYHVYVHVPSFSDPSLTEQNVRHVMEVVEQRKWRSMGIWFSVPDSILNKIGFSYDTDDERISALANYMVTSIPGITWEKIASRLYRLDEERAVERAKPYLHIVPGKL